MGDQEDVQEQEQEDIEEVNISEDEEPETPPAPEPLSQERVEERLAETNLPSVSVERLASGQYDSEETLDAVIAEEVKYVKKLTGSGEPFGMSGSPQEKEPLTEEQRKDRFNEVMDRVGGRRV